MFHSTGAKATFFTLGWVAKRYPALIRRIVENGHEVASHGLEHRRADSQTHSEFLSDLKGSKSLLEDVSGVAINGYRAASFSITRKNLWALDAIAEAGYKYSSSIYPIRHDRYGIPDAPRFAFKPFAKSDFLEIPITSFKIGGTNLPCGGGGFFQAVALLVVVLPITKSSISRCGPMHVLFPSLGKSTLSNREFVTRRLSAVFATTPILAPCNIAFGDFCTNSPGSA